MNSNSVKSFRRPAGILSSAELVAFAFTAASLVACGGAQKAPSGPPALADLLPDDAPVVAHADVARFRASKHYPKFKELFEGAGGGDTGEPNRVRSLYGKTEEVALAVWPEGAARKEDGILLLRGNLTEADARELALTMNADGDTVTPWSHGKHSGWTVGRTHVFLLAPKTIAAVEGHLESLLVTAAKPDGRAPLAKLQPEGFGGHVVSFAADLPATGIDVASAKAGAPGPVQRALEAVAVSGHVDLVDGVDVRARLVMRDGSAAAVLKKELDSTIAELRGNPMLALMGVGTLLAGTSVTAKDADVVATLRLDGKTFEGWVNQVYGLVQSALSSFAASVTEAGAVSDGASAADAPAKATK